MPGRASSAERFFPGMPSFRTHVSISYVHFISKPLSLRKRVDIAFLFQQFLSLKYLKGFKKTFVLFLFSDQEKCKINGKENSIPKGVEKVSLLNRYEGENLTSHEAITKDCNEGRSIFIFFKPKL